MPPIEPSAAEGDWGVYIHVPFCVSRCRYCDFNTYSGMDKYAGAYFAALGKEITAFHAGGTTGCFRADTVFFGGGTPSFVDPAYILRLLALIPRTEGAGAWECTVEANPGTVDDEKLGAYARAGVNRISFGLQSTHETHLKMLGRIHTYEDFLRGYKSARNYGFDNISADLLFGLPGQTVGEWERTLEAVVSLGIRHLSCYSLSLEEGTPLRAAVESGDLPYPDEDADRDMYAFAASYLRSAGIRQYELSNFAEPGRECRHNLKYWTGKRYRGFGAGAHSYDGRYRYANEPTITGYIERLERSAGAGAGESEGVGEGEAAGGSAYAGGGDGVGMVGGERNAARAAVTELTEITAAETEKEFIILRLRLTRGFSEAEFRTRFGRGFTEKYAAESAELRAADLIQITPGARVALTPKGMDLANKVFVKFI
jgi:oxygen-independent coproporphyrinogen-3 oxidase